MSDVSQFLAQSSGSRYPAFKWGNEPGMILSGTILETPRIVNQPNLNTGQPEDNLVVSIKTPDGHEFALWVRRGFLAQAIAEAVREAGADGLAEGGTLHVKHTAMKDTGKPQPARVFKARYQPPAPSSVSPADIFGGNLKQDEPF
jgi:hypothetical protein